MVKGVYAAPFSLFFSLLFSCDYGTSAGQHSWIVIGPNPLLWSFTPFLFDDNLSNLKWKIHFYFFMLRKLFYMQDTLSSILRSCIDSCGCSSSIAIFNMYEMVYGGIWCVTCYFLWLFSLMLLFLKISFRKFLKVVFWKLFINMSRNTFFIGIVWRDLVA